MIPIHLLNHQTVSMPKWPYLYRQVKMTIKNFSFLDFLITILLHRSAEPTFIGICRSFSDFERNPQHDIGTTRGPIFPKQIQGTASRTHIHQLHQLHQLHPLLGVDKSGFG